MVRLQCEAYITATSATCTHSSLFHVQLLKRSQEWIDATASGYYHRSFRHAEDLREDDAEAAELRPERAASACVSRHP